MPSRSKTLTVDTRYTDARLYKAKRPSRPAAFCNAVDPQKKGKAQSRHQARIQQLEEELALLTSYTSDTIYRLRYDTMSYDYISPAVSRLLGFSVEEMRRMPFRSLILQTRSVSDGLKTIESFDALESRRKEGDVSKWQADYLLQHKDGRHVWVSDVSHPWFDENGNVVGSVGSLRDITDRVEAEKRANAELNRLANTDALTNLANRREFFGALERELRRIQRSDSELSMLILDIDHFKRINDHYGHDVGDKVLVELSGLLGTVVRDIDLVARIGGEEFGVILPETSSQGAFWVAERIRETVIRHQFALGVDKSPLSCSVSAGVATACAGEDMQASDLYKMADTRLYIAKHDGRNQVGADEIRQTH